MKLDFKLNEQQYKDSTRAVKLLDIMYTNWIVVCKKGNLLFKGKLLLF